MENNAPSNSQSMAPASSGFDSFVSTVKSTVLLFIPDLNSASSPWRPCTSSSSEYESFVSAVKSTVLSVLLFIPDLNSASSPWRPDTSLTERETKIHHSNTPLFVLESKPQRPSANQANTSRGWSYSDPITQDYWNVRNHNQRGNNTEEKIQSFAYSNSSSSEDCFGELEEYTQNTHLSRSSPAVPHVPSRSALGSSHIDHRFNQPHAVAQPQSPRAPGHEGPPNRKQKRQVQKTKIINFEYIDAHLPEKWLVNCDDIKTGNYFLEQIPSNSAEYSQICNLLKTERKYKIVHIIENPWLLLMYKLKLKEINLCYGNCEERRLFHGTKFENQDSICRNNFDWRKWKRCLFGQGVSFSPSFLYATDYPKKDNSDDMRLMFLVKVMVARSCKGHRNMITPPPGYDTSQRPNGNVIVKYDDYTFYPEYAIHYKRRNIM